MLKIIPRLPTPATRWHRALIAWMAERPRPRAVQYGERTEAVRWSNWSAHIDWLCAAPLSIGYRLAAPRLPHYQTRTEDVERGCS